MQTRTRTLVTLGLLGLLAGGTALLLDQDPPNPGATGTYPVLIQGPEGILFNGTVTVANATAHTALTAAAKISGLTVEVIENPTYRPCGTYVRAIGGHAEGDRPGAGWVYEVQRHGAWMRPVVGACAFGLEPGDQVRWTYTT